jgi:hypothetical protein
LETVIVGVLAPVLHWYAAAVLVESVAVDPEQIVTAVPGNTLVFGSALTVSLTEFEVALQPKELVMTTLYAPEVVAVMFCWVEPLLQR